MNIQICLSNYIRYLNFETICPNWKIISKVARTRIWANSNNARNWADHTKESKAHTFLSLDNTVINLYGRIVFGTVHFNTLNTSFVANNWKFYLLSLQCVYSTSRIKIQKYEQKIWLLDLIVLFLFQGSLKNRLVLTMKTSGFMY